MPAGGVATVPHSRLEDVTGVVVGTFVTALGLTLLGSVGAVTGGTAGLALLIGYATGLSFAVVFVVLTLPFLALAWTRKGRAFTLRTLASVVLVGAFSALHESVLTLTDDHAWHKVLTGDLIIGIGLLIVFRHGSSLGGFNVLALVAQEQFGLSAGYVQMALDVAVVLVAFAVAPWEIVLLSAAGAVVLNLVLAMNHRPGRYRA
ncbi:YitT family protein [Nocardioidaceae bacterium]|nr:YitT family protein [Nocardioidaceae bacterium]